MADQEKHIEENKEHSRISEDGFNSASIQNPPTKIGFTSIILSAAFYLSIIYLVLFISLFALSLAQIYSVLRLEPFYFD